LEKWGVEIVAADKLIAKLQIDIQLVKGVKRCPSCGADVPVSSGFCGKCGSATEVTVFTSQTISTETGDNQYE
jgi:predicted amidophosphoribosyltransferase